MFSGTLVKFLAQQAKDDYTILVEGQAPIHGAEVNDQERTVILHVGNPEGE